jgi:hypothetical protein
MTDGMKEWVQTEVEPTTPAGASFISDVASAFRSRKGTYSERVATLLGALLLCISITNALRRRMCYAARLGAALS